MRKDRGSPFWGPPSPTSPCLARPVTPPLTRQISPILAQGLLSRPQREGRAQAGRQTGRKRDRRARNGQRGELEIGVWRRKRERRGGEAETRRFRQ